MTSLQQIYEVGQLIDTNALGYSARVTLATHWASGQDVAFKILRLEHLQDAQVWKQFALETHLLERLRNLPAMVKMVDYGYVSDVDHEIPSAGDILSCMGQLKQFAQEMPSRMGGNWRPYIALELLPAENSLLNLARGADGDGRRPLRLPTEEGLALAMQFCEFLLAAHAQDVVYWDHKPEHVYWDGSCLRLIDLNVSRFLTPDLGERVKAAEKIKDLRYMLMGALYTAFTGSDFRFQNQPPQPTPSSPHTVEHRFNGLSHLDFSLYESLLPELGELINETLKQNSGITVEKFLDHLRQLAATLGWEVGYPVTEEARAARREIQQGLSALRQAQENLDKARQHFLSARALNPADPESERLYRDASEFYQRRVLP
jgi:serine/threonine protein kinase